MKASLLSAVLLTLLSAASFGHEPGLEFLSNLPELRDLSLKMSEDQLKSHIDKHGLYAKKELQKERVSYWVLTPGGENVFVGFEAGKCTGVQRMQPVPKQLIKDEISASDYQAWMEKRKAALSNPSMAADPPKAVEVAGEPGKPAFMPKNGFVPDAKTAIKIAVAVWESIYGEAKIAGEKPYQAELTNGIWTVRGSHPAGTPGGAAIAEISKDDGRIVRVIHEQ